MKRTTKQEVMELRMRVTELTQRIQLLTEQISKLNVPQIIQVVHSNNPLSPLPAQPYTQPYPYITCGNQSGNVCDSAQGVFINRAD